MKALRLGMSNDYEIRGDIVVLFLNRKDGTRIEALVDVADLPKIQSFPGTWCASWTKSVRAFCVNGVSRKYSEIGHGEVCLSRFIMDAPRGLEVDHINHDPLDNRRCNLRLVSPSENKQNLRGATKRSKTGIRGVSWCMRTGKWRAAVQVNRKMHHIGYFNNLADAERAVVAGRAAYMPYSPEARYLKEADSR